MMLTKTVPDNPLHYIRLSDGYNMQYGVSIEDMMMYMGIFGNIIGDVIVSGNIMTFYFKDGSTKEVTLSEGAVIPTSITDVEWVSGVFIFTYSDNTTLEIPMQGIETIEAVGNDVLINGVPLPLPNSVMSASLIGNGLKFANRNGSEYTIALPNSVSSLSLSGNHLIATRHNGAPIDLTLPASAISSTALGIHFVSSDGTVTDIAFPNAFINASIVGNSIRLVRLDGMFLDVPMLDAVIGASMRPNNTLRLTKYSGAFVDTALPSNVASVSSIAGGVRFTYSDATTQDVLFPAGITSVALSPDKNSILVSDGSVLPIKNVLSYTARTVANAAKVGIRNEAGVEYQALNITDASMPYLIPTASAIGYYAGGNTKDSVITRVGINENVNSLDFGARSRSVGYAAVAPLLATTSNTTGLNETMLTVPALSGMKDVLYMMSLTVRYNADGNAGAVPNKAIFGLNIVQGANVWEVLNNDAVNAVAAASRTSLVRNASTEHTGSYQGSNSDHLMSFAFNKMVRLPSALATSTFDFQLHFRSSQNGNAVSIFGYEFSIVRIANIA